MEGVACAVLALAKDTQVGGGDMVAKSVQCSA